MPETCVSCGREKTWEHDALCFACLPTGDVQTEIDALRDELDELDLRIRRHARALDRLRHRRRSLADRLHAWETLADEPSETPPGSEQTTDTHRTEQQ